MLLKCKIFICTHEGIKKFLDLTKLEIGVDDTDEITGFCIMYENNEISFNIITEDSDEFITCNIEDYTLNTSLSLVEDIFSRCEKYDGVKSPDYYNDEQFGKVYVIVYEDVMIDN